MTHVALTIIRDEHAALAAVMNAMQHLLAKHRRLRTLPDFAVLRAMVFYLDEFPEKRHHRKESDLLFPKLRARTPLMRELLDRLDMEHARGERAIRDLEHRLIAFEMLGESRRADFEGAAGRFADFYRSHMAVEEKQVLPLAEQVLTVDDWDELDEAFAINRDPLTGHEPEREYQALFAKILSAYPYGATVQPHRQFART